MELANRIRIARSNCGMTQQKLARLVGVTRSAVANWEQVGKNIKPSTYHLQLIALCADTSFEWLATGTPEVAPSEDGMRASAPTWNTPEELLLIQAFREAPENVRRHMLRMAKNQTGQAEHRYSMSA